MRKNRPQPKKVFSFVVDGECEVWYLQMLRKNEKLQQINVEPKLPQKKKLSDQYKAVMELAGESEKVFWVIDFDTINKETSETKKGEKTALQELKEYSLQTPANVLFIINNPCLEYWFLLHYKQTSKYFGSYAGLEKELVKHLPDYQKTEKYFKNPRQDIYQRLKPKQGVAIENALKLDRFDFENTRWGLSEMHRIFTELGLN